MAICVWVGVVLFCHGFAYACRCLDVLSLNGCFQFRDEGCWLTFFDLTIARRCLGIGLLSHALRNQSVWSCLWLVHHLVWSGLYGEARPSLSVLFWTGPGKLWFGSSGSVQIWPAAFWSGLPCKDLFCPVSCGLLLSAGIWSAWSDLVCCRLVRFGVVSCDWFGLLGLLLYGLVWAGLTVWVQVLSGLACFTLVWSKLICSVFFCFGLCGFVWSVWYDLVCSGLSFGLFDLFWSCLPCLCQPDKFALVMVFLVSLGLAWVRLLCSALL